MRDQTAGNTRASFEFACTRAGGELICAEIGVNVGTNAKAMCASGMAKKLICVDPYSPYHDDSEYHNQERLDSFKKRAIDTLSIYPEIVVWHFEDSVGASKKFADGYFDYVYIDGDHSYEGVKRDIEAWYPKVKKNGILAGHDYINFKIGLRKAVDEFVKSKGLILEIEEIDWMVVCK
jgi:hypothetical protein